MTESRDSEEREKTRAEAKRLAESEGHKWKDLPKEQRREFLEKVRRAGRPARKEGRRPGAAE